ncbi:MAG: hypothetical protein JWP97_6444 [Labilithrix sp.]|nr:hypothetical protein [Labilithrix sp.]
MTKFPFENTYAKLPDRFFARVQPTKVQGPSLVKLNVPLAELLGLDVAALDPETAAQIFSGNTPPEGADPIALAYAGHQFGGFSRQLGDGRAILLGEIIAKDGKRRDVQLKGSGRTPWSRGGDGRAALGPVLREYLVSETMHAFGIPTTRALAAVTTGEPVFREGALPGAVLTRVAASHLRVGTFEYFGARNDKEALQVLAGYALERHYPEAKGSGNDALALLERVIEAQANLVARWLGVGFIHGVMNTDNSSISGETIDYGPCAFLDRYDPNTFFSSIDQRGRYAYSNQPGIAQWNLARLAESLLPLFADTEEEAVKLAMDRLARFPAIFEEAHGRMLRAKLGLGEGGDLKEDRALGLDLLERMAAGDADFTLVFRALCAAAEDPANDKDVSVLFSVAGAYHEWAERWRARLAKDETTPAARAASMRRANPAFIPRNHRVEEALAAAVLRKDFGPFERLLAVLSRPYDDQPEHAELTEPPPDTWTDYQTFCGT